MATKYEITKDVSDSFDFGATVNGKDNVYDVHYPTQKQLKPIQMGYAKLKEIDEKLNKVSITDKEKETLTKEAEVVGTEMADAFAEFFVPREKDMMPINDLLEELNIPAKKRFDLMVQTEFSLE